MLPTAVNIRMLSDSLFGTVFRKENTFRSACAIVLDVSNRDSTRSNCPRWLDLKCQGQVS